MKHTALPWKIQGQDIVGNEKDSYICTWSERKDSAEFIIHACNSYYTLLRALKNIEEWTFARDGSSEIDYYNLCKIRKITQKTIASQKEE